MTKSFVIRGGAPLKGKVGVPGDKSLGHRALIFASLAEGRSTIEGLSGGLDNLSTAQIFRDMGARIEIDGSRAIVDGVGLDGLKMPPGALDCGNSGTTMRIVSGILAGQRFGTRLIGDESLSRRPMMRIIGPLRARGAHISGVAGKKEGEMYPPLSIAPLIDGEHLIALEYRSPVASAQVKSCLLMSGLWAKGLTAIAEPTLSRDHTERMLIALGVPLSTVGPMVVLDPDGWNRRWDGFDWRIPGDISSAAFVLGAALVVPESEIVIEGVGVNPTRTGILDVLRAMRADVDVMPKGEAGGGEPIADLAVRHGGLVATLCAGETLTRMIDEVPVFAAIATAASGRTDVRDAAELRVKESDRVSATVATLEAFGADCTELDDGLHIHPGAKLRPAEVESLGDHRIAMTAAVLAMSVDGVSHVHDVECVETSFPGFVETFRTLGADIAVEETA